MASDSPPTDRRQWLVICRDEYVIVTVSPDPDYRGQFVVTCDAFDGRFVTGSDDAESALYQSLGALTRVREVVPLGAPTRAELAAQRDALWITAHAFLLAQAADDEDGVLLEMEARRLLRAALAATEG